MKDINFIIQHKMRNPYLELTENYGVINLNKIGIEYNDLATVFRHHGANQFKL